jgi:hypothetical protein
VVVAAGAVVAGVVSSPQATRVRLVSKMITNRVNNNFLIVFNSLYLDAIVPHIYYLVFVGFLPPF